MSIASLYPSINPSLLLDFANVKRLDPRITFSRTTTATYYDGVTTAKAEENLVLYSQEFDNAYWTKTDTTITANSATTAPDGTTTADLLYPNSTGTDRFVYRSSVSGLISTVYTFSFYAKASGINWVYVGTLGGGTSPATCAFFDLQNGVVGQTGSFFTSATITSVGNSWYRCIVIGTTAVASIFPLIGLANANNSSTVTASGTNGVLLWGAQLEQRSSATAYTATTTQAITNYIPVLQTASAGQARFDHNPTTGESLGLLIEEARTNACPYSEAIGSWSAVNATAQSNVAIAPSGALTADKILPDATASVAHGWYNTITAAASTTYTASIFAKAAEYSWLYLTEGNNVTATAWFNLSTGALGTVTGTGSPSATITSVGNGWYRCSLTFTTAVGATAANIQARVTTADNTNTFTASSGTVGYSGIFVWGAQFETGSFATSYIPNLSTGSTTRNADAASMTGTSFSSWFNNGEGTVYAETTGYASGGNAKGVVSIGAGSSANSMDVYYAPSLTSIQLETITNSVVQATIIAAGQKTKVAAAYKFNDTNFGYDGSVGTTDTSCTVPVCTQIHFGSIYSGNPAYYANGRIKKLAYYPVRCTNAQLQALTS